ncbi:MAG: hypothetical protein AAF679_10720 [Pseudomonadota bacterium]
MQYDLELFLALNEEYKDKPLVPAQPLLDDDSLAIWAPGAAKPKPRRRDKTLSCVNELSIADCQRYFDLVELHSTKTSCSKYALEDGFIGRFGYKRSRLPRYGLGRE